MAERNDYAAGTRAKALDWPQAVWNDNRTTIANITATSFQGGAGDAEVGVLFVAPTSGRVGIKVGASVRNNSGANSDRVFIAPQVFEDDTNGFEILPPTTYNGVSSPGDSASEDYMTAGHMRLLDLLTPGQVYYARVLYRVAAGDGTADLTGRNILVFPLP